MVLTSKSDIHVFMLLVCPIVVMFWASEGEVTRNCKRLDNEELQELYC
jgi:hypothetical protein